MDSVSVVVPVYNEEESVVLLAEGVERVLKPLAGQYEILFIDDGSTDNTLDQLKSLASSHDNIRVFESRRNLGKAIALDIGFKKSRGDIVITMDGDLQDDPDEIPAMMEKLNEGYDLVSGWKQVRHDPLSKTVPSRLFNAVTRKCSGLDIHDFNCGFKVYRRVVVENLDLYGEMHRYIPALAHWKGFKVAEKAVRHHPRKYGSSKYGADRYLSGLFDFMTIAFITRFKNKPMHFFGRFGFFMCLAGGLSGCYLAGLWFARELFGADVGAIGGRPLLSFSVLLIIIGMLFFSTGLLAEMLIYVTRKKDIDGSMVKNVFESRGKDLK